MLLVKLPFACSVPSGLDMVNDDELTDPLIGYVSPAKLQWIGVVPPANVVSELAEAYETVPVREFPLWVRSASKVLWNLHVIPW